MNTVLGQFRRGLLGLSPEETTCARRGFRISGEAMRCRLEAAGGAFLAGYHSALEQGGSAGLARALEKVAFEQRGFAFEGAAMGLALLDSLTPWRCGRLSNFLNGPGEAHAYMVHVGVGWSWARLPFARRRTRQSLDPLLVWLAFDGWGFHEGFFHWPKYISGRAAPLRLRDYERRVFDQGLGRSWWFVDGGNPALIAETIASFSPERQPDLWSGVGLAATYAGIASETVLVTLSEEAGPHRRHLGQGAAFAAKARQRAGNLTDYTDLAVRTLSGLSALEAASLCDTTLENLPATASVPPYEIWRQRIQEHFEARPSSSLHTRRSLERVRHGGSGNLPVTEHIPSPMKR